MNKERITESKENKKSKIPAIINVSVFFTILGLTAVWLLTAERPIISEIENRKLTEKPEFTAETFFNGEYTDGLSMYFNDTVPNRDFFKTIAANLHNLSGIALSGAKVHGSLTPIAEIEAVNEIKTEKAENTEPTDIDKTDTYKEAALIENITTEKITEESVTAENLTPGTPAAAQTEKTQAQTAEEQENRNPVNEIAEGVYTNGQIVVFQNGHWRGISMFGGGSGNAYAESVNAFKRDLGDNIKVYSMIAPTSGAFYTPSNFGQYNASHLTSIESIGSMLENVIYVDCYSVLETKKEEPVYTRTDHHWQPLGAYYAAGEFAKAAGVLFAELSEYTKVVIPDYVGTMYSFTGVADLLNDPEEFIYYKPNNDYKTYYYTTGYVFEYEYPLFVSQPTNQSYSTFMGGDAKIVRIETDVKNGRKLAVLKDSYGNAEIPFYTGSFEEIYVLDIRYFDLNAVDFIKEHEITDVLFTMCTFSAVGSNALKIDEIRTRIN